MPRGYRHLQVSFAGGEMSPEMFARFDDARVRSGAARMRNMICHPRGSAARRPGFAMVRQAKNSDYRVRLLPFRYSSDQTFAIEMGRATANVGYFRFHTDGATLLQSRPGDHRPPLPATAINIADGVWTMATTVTYKTGDPIVFTLAAKRDCTLDTSTNLVTVPDAPPIAISNGDAVIFATTGTLPTGIEPSRIYYIREAGIPSGNTFKLAAMRGGDAIDLTGTQSGAHTIGILPTPERLGVDFPLDVNARYYAIVGDPLADDEMQIAASHADAMAGTKLIFPTDGTVANSNSIRVHYDYDNGSTALYTDGFPYYCRKTPWGTRGSGVVNANDHDDHLPSIEHYWVRQSGVSGLVTFTPANDVVGWLGHTFSEGDPIVFYPGGIGALPAEITPGTIYYVRYPDINPDVFQLSTSPTSPTTHTFTGAGTETGTAFVNGFYEIPHYYAEDALFEVNHAQSGDVVTLVHMDRPIAELRRLGATHWLLEDVLFNGAVSPPENVTVAVFKGEGNKVTSVSTTNDTLTTSAKHGLAFGEPVMVIDVQTDAGTVLVPTGHYIVEEKVDEFSVKLKNFESGVLVDIATSGTPRATARIRSSGYAEDWEEKYVITAVDSNGEESEPSAELEVTNNLLVIGAYNRLWWDAVPGAARYRVYKQQNGIYGFIGEVDAEEQETFKDDNIGPDLSYAPPILDRALRRSSLVTFQNVPELVVWPGHGLEGGAPIVFDTDGTLPTGLTYGTTYYVLNPTEDSFQLTDTPTGEVEVSFSTDGSGIHSATAGFWPSAVSYFEQRRAFAGGRQRPQDFWLTASSTESDLSYTIPTQDSDRIYNRLAARERSEIRHAMSASHLLLLTSSAEYRITPLNDDALTPGSVSARAPSHIGASTVAPLVVNNVVLFPAARGGHLREMGFLDRVGDYLTGDVSIRAAHLFDNRTILQMAYQQAPHPIVWAVSSAGTMLGFTYVPEEQIAGWHEHDIDGTIESCTVVAEGLEDRLYIVAKRGATRWIERMGPQTVDAIEDVFYVDSGISYDGTAVGSLFVPHLAGLAVSYLGDGIVRSGTVSAAGILTMAATASTIHVGLSYDCELQTLPIGMQVDAALGSGRSKNVNQVWARVRDSGGFEIGPELNAMVEAPPETSGVLQTRLVPVNVLGRWDDDGQVYIRQDEPLPLIVTGLTVEIASGG